VEREWEGRAHEIIINGFMLYWGAGIERLEYVYWVIRPLFSGLCGPVQKYRFIHTTSKFNCNTFKEALSITSKHIHQP
jgi:hypothetical protein